VKEVQDPRRFGIVERGPDGRVTRLVEKPERPTSNLAITGIYYFTRGRPLFEALRELQRRGLRTKGEFQLTDAMQLMVQGGQALTTFPVAGWYDCGKTETLLSTNQELLDLDSDDRHIPGSVIIPPVAIDPTALVRNAVIGPYVSVAAGAMVKNSIVRNSILNENAQVENILLDSSLIGDHASVRGTFRRLNVGDSSEVELG